MPRAGALLTATSTIRGPEEVAPDPPLATLTTNTQKGRTQMSVTAVVRHKVADYDAWRAVYDTLADLQTNGGVTAESVHRLIGDGNDLLVVHQFETAGAAQAFFKSGELRDGMERAGVQGPPTIDIFQDA